LLVSHLRLEELRRVTRYPQIRKRLRPALVGELVSALVKFADYLVNGRQATPAAFAQAWEAPPSGCARSSTLA